MSERTDRILADPERYFTEARERAREMVERDVQRERERLRKHWPWWLRWLL